MDSGNDSADNIQAYLKESAGWPIKRNARCYAREYLRTLAHQNEYLAQAAEAYAKTVECLKPVWLEPPASNAPEKECLAKLAQRIRNAKTTEEEGIAHIRQYLAAIK